LAESWLGSEERAFRGLQSAREFSEELQVESLAVELTTSVEGKVRLDQSTRGEGSHERELSSENGSADDSGEALGVLSRIGVVGAFHTQKVEHGALRQKNCESGR
jgi:hypothetical protein